jgi:hypothetical protein
LKVTPFFFMVLLLYFHELPGAHVCASQKQKPFASSFDSSAMYSTSLHAAASPYRLKEINLRGSRGRARRSLIFNGHSLPRICVPLKASCPVSL